MSNASNGRAAGLHEMCVSHAVVGKPERICKTCYDAAEHRSGIDDPSAFELAKWIAGQGVG